jgi:hypothetical protein
MKNANIARLEAVIFILLRILLNEMTSTTQRIHWA